MFDSLATTFTDSHRVVVLTRRGKAPSEVAASGYDLDTLTADVTAAIDALGLTRVHLVAHSFGGVEATQLATIHRDRVASVVYLDAALDLAAAETVMKQAPMPNPRTGRRSGFRCSRP